MVSLQPYLKVKKINNFISKVPMLINLLVFLSVLTGFTGKDKIPQSEISNGKVKVVAQTDEDGNSVLHFYAINRLGIYTELVKSFRPNFHSTLLPKTSNLYNTARSPFRYLLSEIHGSTEVYPEKSNLEIKSEKNDIHFIQNISIKPNSNEIYISVDVEFPKDTNKLDFLLNIFELQLDHAPYFVHTPSMKFDNAESHQNRFQIDPSNQQVIGDRSFHSPAIILKDKDLFAALMPDLEKINQFRVISPDARRQSRIGKNIYFVPEVPDRFTMPTALDFSLNSGLSSNPIFSFGFMDAIISHHIRYNRPDTTDLARTIYSRSIHYGFTLILDAQNKFNYQDVSHMIWAKYGSAQFKRKTHLAMPFQAYEHLVDSVTFQPSPYPDIDKPLVGYKNTGSWLEWEENGVPMGGYRSAINWWNDKMHNSAFWNNARDASGFWYWGELLHDQKKKDQAHRIINWCLSAPQNKSGLFATLFNANTKTWSLQFMDPVNGQCNFFKTESHSYDVVTMSKTGAHLLQYYLSCEKDQRIINYLTPYAKWLLTVIDDRGSVPSYVSDDMIPSDILRYSAHPGATLWFLAEMYNVTGEKSFLNGAQRIAGYLEKEIIPEAKWIDMEQFFSCGSRPIFFDRDIAQNEIARGTLCQIWASEGFAALHRATGSAESARAGAACVDYLSLYQCSWNPHFIYTAYPFGGFVSDNADSGNFLDARQAECVRPFAYWGKVLGRQDLIERAVAAAHASMVLINHPRHKVNEIYQFTNIYPIGLGPENIDHEAVPESAMRTHPGWGEGSAVFGGLTDAMRAFGGGYINVKKNLAVGVDGINFSHFSLENNQMNIQLSSDLYNLKLPWTQPYRIELLIEGVNYENLKIKINQTSISKKPNANHRIKIELQPDGNIKEI